VPLIGRVPGAPQGVVAQDMVELYDILPSFLNLAGTAPHHTQFGRSLLPQIHGGPGDPNRAAFTEAGLASTNRRPSTTPPAASIATSRSFPRSIPNWSPAPPASAPSATPISTARKASANSMTGWPTPARPAI
jgi:hypothetical protein